MSKSIFSRRRNSVQCVGINMLRGVFQQPPVDWVSHSGKWGKEAIFTFMTLTQSQYIFNPDLSYNRSQTSQVLNLTNLERLLNIRIEWSRK